MTRYRIVAPMPILLAVPVAFTTAPVWLPIIAWQGWTDWGWVELFEPLALFWLFLMWCIVTTDGAV